MKRMATQSHVFAYCYLSAAVSGATLFALADLFWLIAAFRPDRDPALDPAAQRPGLDHVHRARRHARRPEPAAGSRGLPRRRAQPGLPALGRPLQPSVIAVAMTPAAVRRRVQDRAVGLGRRRSRSGCAIIAFGRLHRRDVLRAAASARASAGRRGGRRRDDQHDLAPRGTATPRRRQARRLDRVLDRAGLLHLVRGHLLRPRQGDATAAARHHHRRRWSQFFSAHATTIQIGFALLMLVVGGAGGVQRPGRRTR